MKNGHGDSPEGIEKCPVRIYTETSWREAAADVVREVHLEVYLNGRKMITIACTGLHTEELAVGWLRSEGIIRTAGEMASVEVGGDGMSIHVNTRPDLPGLFAGGGTVISSSGARSAAFGIDREDGEACVSGALSGEPGSEAGEGRNMAAIKPLAMGTEIIPPARIFTLMEEMIAAVSIH